MEKFNKCFKCKFSHNLAFTVLCRLVMRSIMFWVRNLDRELRKFGVLIGFESRLELPSRKFKNSSRNPTGKFTFIQSETVKKIMIHNLTILIFLKNLRFEVIDRDFWDIFRSNESKFWSEFLRFLLEYFYNFSAPTVIFQISHPSFEPNFF
jgi:hypothetical protein